ncbi:MAG: FG-GAP repeat-containing protein [Rhodocyclaceae bacterium]|nr:MAG: FG-GAP repeat-containing protein [Rhodocyclaceae bacterium]
MASGYGGFVINGQCAYDGSGRSVASAGDVNGDGLSDLIVGADGSDPAAGSNAGRSYVIFGSTTGVFAQTTVDQMGGDGNDFLPGTYVGETLVGGAGNDYLVGNGGADVLYGGAGDDRIDVNSGNIAALGANFIAGNYARIDGGSGIDTLAIAGAFDTLNLTAVANQGGASPSSASRIESIERIDLTGYGNNTLIISSADVVDMAGMNSFNDGNGWTGLGGTVRKHQLVVNGDAGDLVNAAGFWTSNGTLSNGAHTYTVYDAADSAAQLLVDVNVARNISAPPPSNMAPSFAVGDGKVITAIGSGADVGYRMARQPDGRIVVTGTSHNGSNLDFALARYNADGSLDTSFDSDGKLTTDFGVGDDYAYGVAIQSDGRIVVAGMSWNGSTNDFALARYNADGSLDTTFSGDGKLITVVGPDNGGYDVTLQADGKILVAGSGWGGSNTDVNLVRYNADGSLDTSFSGDGIVTTAIGSYHDFGQGVTVQPDGKILVAGWSDTGSNKYFALLRYNDDGSLDTTFSGDGMLTTAIGAGDDRGISLALQADGRILVAGDSWNGSDWDFGLVRYNADGSLDSSFDGDGKLTTGIGAGDDWNYRLTLQPDGKILMVGISHNGSNYDLSLVRFNTDGSLDSSFSGDGKVTTAIGAGDDWGYSVTVQPDGRILVAGSSDNGSNSDFALLRYNPDGSLDSTFDAVGTLNGTPTFTEGGPAVVLDSTVQIFDPELAGAGNYAGASVTLARQGGADPQDIFSGSGNLGFPGGDTVLSGITIGTVTQGGGTLTLAFNANATQARVDEALSSIAYANTSGTPPPSVQIDWNFNDGNSGAQGTGGALSAIGSTTVSITPVADPGIELSAIAAGTGGFVINGQAASVQSGRSVSSAGDVNGDGFGDLIVGAHASFSGYDAGRSYVVFGRTDTAAVDLSAIANGSGGFVINGQFGADYSGFSVASAGDVNGDGLNDLIVGAPLVTDGVGGFHTGYSYVVFGQAGGTAINLAAVAAGAGGFVIRGQGAQEQSGSTVAGAGDVNGDGLADLIVGAPLSDPFGDINNNAGRSYVVFGRTGTAAVDLSAIIGGSGGFVINGQCAGDGSGNSAASAGDVNGDGLADLIVGASSASGGHSYVVFGHTETSPINLGAVAAGSGGFVINGGSDDHTSGTGSGTSVASAGDVNGDGLADLIVGAPFALSPGGIAGRSYVVFGQSGAGPIELTAIANGSGGFVINGQSAYDRSGISVASAGDMNGDGLADLIVGAYFSDPASGSNAGRSYVVFGQTSGSPIELSAVAAGMNGFVINGQAGDDRSGISVGSAGDVNGDGLADLIVGANYGDPAAGGNAGRSYVIFGTTSGVFSQTNVDQMGSPGNDLLNGSGIAETLVGGAGNDTLVGNGGADVLYGGAGDDRFEINGGNLAALGANFTSGNYARIDGGSGIDTLAIVGAGETVNLAAIANQGGVAPSSTSRIESVERIDLTGSGNNTLTLSARDVVDMAGMNAFNNGNGWTGLGGTVQRHQLVVDGDAGDIVNVAGLWTDAGTVSNGAHTYTVYNADDSVAQLLINTDVINLNQAPSFAAGDGKLTTAIGSGNDAGYSVTVQPDGRILVAGVSHNGSNNDFALVRYNADGTLDTGFDGDGTLITAIGTGDDTGQSVTVQADGKILVAGYSFNGSNNDFALVRYNADGTLDTGFDGDGKLTTVIGTELDNGYSVTVQPDGKILVAGESWSGDADFALVRYMADGSLDTGFSGDGMLVTDFAGGNDFANCSVLQPDGKILVAGHNSNEFAVVRYNADGTLDGGFGAAGMLTTDIGASFDVAQSITLQADGKILVAGGSYVGGAYDFALVRYNTDGTLDGGFGTAGMLTTAIGSNEDWGRSVTVQSDGKILLAGWSWNGSNNDFALVRYNTNGSLDSSFDGDGKLTTAIGAGLDNGFSITVQADGRILVAGASDNGSNTDFALVRYNVDGSLDTFAVTHMGTPGNDVLIGSPGNDLMMGGAGADQFVFEQPLNVATNLDRIRDFVAAIDQFKLDDSVFTGLVSGTLTSDAFVSGAGTTTAADATDRIIYNLTSGMLYFDADGNGGGSAPIAFAQITSAIKPALTASDFVAFPAP